MLSYIQSCSGNLTTLILSIAIYVIVVVLAAVYIIIATCHNYTAGRDLSETDSIIAYPVQSQVYVVTIIALSTLFVYNVKFPKCN